MIVIEPPLLPVLIFMVLVLGFAAGVTGALWCAHKCDSAIDGFAVLALASLVGVLGMSSIWMTMGCP